MEPVALPTTYDRAAADAAGMSRAQLRADGVRVTRGVYVSRAVPLTLPRVCAAVLSVSPAGTAVSHLTAAGLFGAPVRAGRPVHVSVPPGAARPRRDRLWVHVRDLARTDVVRRHGLPVTSGAQTFLDLAAVLPAPDLVAVGDALLRDGHLVATDLAERLDRAAGVRGVLRARECAPLLTPLAASRPESLLRYWITTSDLPAPEVQLPVHDRWGKEVAHADLGYRRQKVALEYEGRQHAARQQFRRDVERYSLMAADGWLVLLFTDVHLGRPHVVVDRTRRALVSRGARW